MSTSKKRLLDIILIWGLDLWAFTNVFEDKSKNYEFYLEHWKDLTRIKMTYPVFKETQDIVRRIKKK